MKDKYLEYMKNPQTSTAKTNIPIRKWVKDMKKHFTEEHIQMATKYMKRFSTSLAIWEAQIKTTMRYYDTPIIKTKFFF